MILYKNLGNLRICNTTVDFYVTLEGEKLICRVRKAGEGDASTGLFLSNYTKVVYNGETKSFSDNRAAFDYADGVSSMRIQCSAPAPAQKIYYDGVYYGNSFPVYWLGPAEEPVCDFSPVSIHEDYANRLTWSFTSPGGNPCAAVELWYYEKSAEATSYVGVQLFSGKNARNQYTHTLSAGEAGKTCYYRLAYCSYASEDAAAENYLTYGETVTTVYTIGETKKYPAAPQSITYGNPTAGGVVRATWIEAEDEFNEIAEYVLERRFDVGEWTTVYCGSSAFFSDRLPVELSAETVSYRVRSVNTEGNVSEWLYGAPLAVIRSNIYVRYQGEIRPALQIYIGGRGTTGAIAYVGGDGGNPT